jgi:predicted ATP-binding protein involved in virulence
MSGYASGNAPSWWYLSERFIDTQFIVSAHSPLIVQAAEQANIVVLKRGEQDVTVADYFSGVYGYGDFC